MKCPYCTGSLTRLPRHGFLQRKVYPLLGYFPWECVLCRRVTMLKKEHQRRSQRSPKQTSDTTTTA
jgi:hypothetical protein